MNIKYFIGAGLVSMSLTATGAQAADWSGIYFGAHAGHSFLTMDDINPAVTSEPSGYSGGTQFGYLAQIGPLIAGVEGTYTALDIDEFGYTELNNGTSTATADISDIFAVAARGGIALDNAMVYGKVGYAYAGVGYDNMRNFESSSLLNFDERESGLLLGAGTEFAISESVSIGVDYTYINFDIDTDIRDLELATLRSDIDANFDSDHHQLSVRINFRLN